MTGAELREELSISASTLSRYKARGCPRDKGGPGKGDRYCPEEMAAWMSANSLTGDPGRPQGDESEELRAARTRKITAMALSWELKNGVASGKWLDRRAVESARVRKVVALRDGMLALGAVISEAMQFRTAKDIESEINARMKILVDQFAEPMPLDDYPFNPSKRAAS